MTPSLYRSGLAVALLAAAPMRIANFAALEIGHHLRHAADHWTIHLAAEETKTRRTDIWPLAAQLSASLDYYLDAVRPSLLKRPRKQVTTARLWIGDSGYPIGDQVLRRTVAELASARLVLRSTPTRSAIAPPRHSRLSCPTTHYKALPCSGTLHLRLRRSTTSSNNVNLCIKNIFSFCSSGFGADHTLTTESDGIVESGGASNSAIRSRRACGYAEQLAAAGLVAMRIAARAPCRLTSCGMTLQYCV